MVVCTGGVSLLAVEALPTYALPAQRVLINHHVLAGSPVFASPCNLPLGVWFATVLTLDRRSLEVSVMP